MATPKAAQTSVKVYRPSFLDTQGDLRPSVERELVTISNAFQTQQAFLDNIFPRSADGGAIELRNVKSTTPFIDFHYDYKNRLNEDFNARIINDDSGVLRFRRSDGIDEGYATIGVGTTNIHGQLSTVSSTQAQTAINLNNFYPHQNSGTNYSSRITMNASDSSVGHFSIWGEERVGTYWAGIFEVQWGKDGSGNNNPAHYFKMWNNGKFEAEGEIWAQGAKLTSDRTLKDNIKPIENALDKVDALVGSTWDWKDHKGSGLGLIAQDVQTVLPEAVDSSDPTHLRLDYNGVIGLLVNAVKELKEEVRQLKENK